ncbi:MAG: hypothetical protein WD874_01230 [Parcubacteria group bacterium]
MSVLDIKGANLLFVPSLRWERKIPPSDIFPVRKLKQISARFGRGFDKEFAHLSEGRVKFPTIVEGNYLRGPTSIRKVLELLEKHGHFEVFFSEIYYLLSYEFKEVSGAPHIFFVRRDKELRRIDLVQELGIGRTIVTGSLVEERADPANLGRMIFQDAVLSAGTGLITSL